MARILLADDDGATRDMVRRALEGDGHQVEATQDGAEAAERLAAGKKFEVLVSDVQMPGLDGIELAKRALSVLPAIGIVLMSGYGEQLEKARLIKAERLDTLSKPFSLEQVRSAVKKVAG